MMAIWKVQIIEQWFSLFEDWHWISLDWCQSDFFVDPLRYSIEKQKEERARKGSSQVSAVRIPLVSRRKMRFFSSQMLLCFIGCLRLLFSCLSPTTAVDKRMTISWTLAGVTGETLKQPINSYFISRFSRKSRRSFWHVVVFCIFCEKKLRHISLHAKLIKTLAIKIIIAILHHGSNHLSELCSTVQFFFTSSEMHSTCILHFAHTSSTRDWNMRRKRPAV